MKRKIISAAMMPLLLFVGLVQTGCFGTFALTRKVYEFNDSLDNKFVKTIVFYAFNIVPVYGVAGFVDVVVLNLLEFWTGSNPMAMQEGEIEKQVIQLDDKEYLVIATKNSFEVQLLGANGAAEQTSFIEFCDEDMTWSYRTESDYALLSKFIGYDENHQPTFELYSNAGTHTHVAEGKSI